MTLIFKRNSFPQTGKVSTLCGGLEIVEIQQTLDYPLCLSVCFFFVVVVWFKCEDPLGMENKVITDAQISMSSSLSWWSRNVRLKNRYGWEARWDNQKQWIKVDLYSYVKVTRVATQGSAGVFGPGWVTKFKISYSRDGVTWQMYKEPGNSNASVKVTC